MPNNDHGNGDNGDNGDGSSRKRLDTADFLLILDKMGQAHEELAGKYRHLMDQPFPVRLYVSVDRVATFTIAKGKQTYYMVLDGSAHDPGTPDTTRPRAVAVLPGDLRGFLAITGYKWRQVEAPDANDPLVGVYARPDHLAPRPNPPSAPGTPPRIVH